MAYDKKFKKRVLEYIEEGHTQKETAELFGIGTTTIKEWKKQYKETRELTIKPRRRKPKKIEPEKQKSFIRENPDAYLSEIAKEFNCVTSAVHKALKKLKMTRKKR